LKVEVIKLDEMKTNLADIPFDRFSETSSGVNNIELVDRISLPTMPEEWSTTTNMYLTMEKRLPSASPRRFDESNNTLLAHDENSGPELLASYLELPRVMRHSAVCSHKIYHEKAR
jgi:hypothetical protein